MSVADGRSTDPFIAIPQEVCRDFAKSSRLEWLDTNGTGAYAMGSVAGVNTRTYHAALIGSLHPPADRFSFLARVEEQVTAGGNSYELATVQYPGAITPRGYQFLSDFRLDPLPTWRFDLDGSSIEKTLCLLNGRQAVLLRYRASTRLQLSVRLFLAFRDYHGQARETAIWSRRNRQEPHRLIFRPYAHLPPLAILHNAIRFEEDSKWFRNHEYLRELDRGLPYREDLFSPGALIFQSEPGVDAWLVATIEDIAVPVANEVQSLLAEERTRRSSSTPPGVDAALVRSLNQFRIKRADGFPSLLAGYPWFTDWSRDTLISLPALQTAGFPASETRAILELLLQQRSGGLIPNRFSDQHGAPEYNTADATLWLFVAADDYLKRTRDDQFLRDVLYPATREIMAAHYRGTTGPIKVDLSDRLLSAGTAGTQLTWMDARSEGKPVTSRHGKAVEVNALWFNALTLMGVWSKTLGFFDHSARYLQEAARCAQSFRAKFWNEEKGCLYDVIGPAGKDDSVRPNQLFALSLPYPLFTPVQARQIMNVVREKLLTPVGLRTLDLDNPFFEPRYEGDSASRDRAYHQGTVWPWLFGPFVAGWLYAHEESEEARALCRDLLTHFLNEAERNCLTSINEVYDAVSPYRPAGCPAQLWSVAQILLASTRVGEEKLIQRAAGAL